MRTIAQIIIWHSRRKDFTAEWRKNPDGTRLWWFLTETGRLYSPVKGMSDQDALEWVRDIA